MGQRAATCFGGVSALRWGTIAGLIAIRRQWRRRASWLGSPVRKAIVHVGAGVPQRWVDIPPSRRNMAGIQVALTL
jgi:hypothetical protein